MVPVVGGTELSPIRAESSSERAAREQAELMREQNRLLAENNRLLGAETPTPDRPVHVISQSEYEDWLRQRDRAAERAARKRHKNA
jgi:hypothetical protein